MARPHRRPLTVFRDPSGGRTRLVGHVTRTVGTISTLLGFALILGLLIPPLLPTVVIADQSTSARRPPFRGALAARQRLAARHQLFAELATPAVGRAALPLLVASTTAAARASKPIVAGFYVNWDDNSLASLRAHVTQLDWVVCEWGLLRPDGSAVRFYVDPRVLRLVQSLPSARRPKVMLMATNFDSARSDFAPDVVRALVASPTNRSTVIAQLVTAVRRYGLGGVTVDFEEIPEDARTLSNTLQFMRELSAALHPLGAVVSQAVAATDDPATLRRYAGATDYLIAMLYDEHVGRHDSGPVASQRWYASQAQRVAAVVAPQKLILGIGAYGYEWNDGDPDAPGDEQTFQDVMRLAHDHRAPVRFDSISLNPYLTWTDPDSTDHVVWFLDGVTGFNELLVARSLGAAGTAVWRLGAEDPSLWNVLGQRVGGLRPGALREMTAGYDVDFRGTGELLSIDTRPTKGRREIGTMPHSDLVISETVQSIPLPFIVRRSGNYPHRVALTFDDGPDGSWTPMILDTLRSRRAPATFFLIGENILQNIELTRRIASEGHEVGNHTFTHPNLALTSRFMTRLELNAAERIIEAVLGRHTAFFRPPYFGDAEPTTADELVPIAIASDIGYATAGLHVDSDDWRELSAPKILSNVLVGRRRAVTCTDSLHEDRAEKRPLERGCSGSIVLLHDGGGNRAATVAAVGAMIDSLRAGGDTLVLLSALAGMTHAAAMSDIPRSSVAERIVELVTFGTLGAIETATYWIFVLAVSLGISRLGVVLAVAALQRRRAGRQRAPDPAYAPAVSVVVPAFREERVIVKTITSLLEQDYAGELEIVVVDDGSPDRTYDVAAEAYQGDSRVRVLRQENAGKPNALNHGIAQARGEIIIALDADTVFLRDSIRRLVQPLADPRVAAVAGNAKVGNRMNLVTRWQAVEYVTSQNLDRRAFALFDCITVVPGAIGAWRRAVIEQLGGFSQDTLAEDQDLTIAIHRAGYSVAYADDAIALTEAPDTLKGLASQRFRWSFGTLQCMWKHRSALLDRRSGTLGMLAMPNVWLFQLLFPAISPLADLMFLWSLVSVWLVKLHHGSSYAMLGLERVLLLYGLFILVDWVAALTAFMMEREDWNLTWFVLTQRFVYRQIMYLVVVRSFFAAIHGRVVGWGSLERKATVGVQPS